MSEEKNKSEQKLLDIVFKLLYLIIALLILIACLLYIYVAGVPDVFKSDEKEIISALINQYQVSEESAKQAAFLSDGNFREALSTFQKGDEGISFLTHFQNFMRVALKFDCNKALEWVDENASNDREKQKQFITYSLAVFRDALMFNFGEKSLVRLSGNERQFLEKFAPFVNQKNYQALAEEFNSTYYYIERNANPKILFMDLLLKTNEFINLK